MANILMAFRRSLVSQASICSRKEPESLQTTNTTRILPSPDHKRIQVDSKQLINSLTTKAQRFDFVKRWYNNDILSMVPIHEMEKFCEDLKRDISTSSTDEVLSLINYFPKNDPFLKSFSNILCMRAAELDFKCLYKLARLFDSDELRGVSDTIYRRLNEIFVAKMENNDCLHAHEIYGTIQFLNTTNHFKKRSGVYTAQYLCQNYSKYGLKWFSRISRSFSKTGFLNQFGDHTYFCAVRSNILKLLHKRTSTNQRPEQWGKECSEYLGNFMIFYGRVRFYDEEVVNAIKELFHGPQNSEIHNLKFVSQFMFMCEHVQYYDEYLFNHFVEIILTNQDRNTRDLVRILNAFARLNHESSAFFAEVVKRVEKTCQRGLSDHFSVWNFMRSCLFMNSYPAVLKRFLSYITSHQTGMIHREYHRSSM